MPNRTSTTMNAYNLDRVKRITECCEYFSVAYMVDDYHANEGVWIIHLMNTNAAIKYMNNGGVWSYTIPLAHHIMEGVEPLMRLANR